MRHIKRMNCSEKNPECFLTLYGCCCGCSKLEKWNNKTIGQILKGETFQ